MQDTKHTIDYFELTDGRHQLIVDSVQIVMFPSDHPAMTAAEIRAIFRLIAAAPDLLVALIMLAECSPCQNGCDPDDMTCASNVARATISRATK